VNFSRFDHHCMATALRLAKKGLYTTDPNPRVGCVIADGERIVGAGWHERAGEAHAEAAALRDLGGSARGMTAYVTLEPCNHQGRTAPCTEALIAAGIARVVIASRDPNEAVSGGGVERLTAAGLDVETGLMSDQAEALNPGFLMRIRHGRPWVRIKIATSLDGRTALRNGESKWISNDASRRDVQHWRARSSAILTGIGTVLADDPRLTARVEGDVAQPLRVVADSRWRTPPESRILAGSGPVVIAGDRAVEVPEGLENGPACPLRLPAEQGRVALGELMKSLAGMEVNEVQVEAGPRLCGALLEQRQVDEILIYQAPLLLGDGAAGPFALGPLESMAERTHLSMVETTSLGDDLRLRLKPEFRN
jgi:diaminohydroxyphosphoribosylaminopyrimidine deaminase/5-amino-6-(5-phosphoribosylamino)uracil reductase